MCGVLRHPRARAVLLRLADPIGRSRTMESGGVRHGGPPRGSRLFWKLKPDKTPAPDSFSAISNSRFF
jgi:hypothetical protein